MTDRLSVDDTVRAAAQQQLLQGGVGELGREGLGGAGTGGRDRRHGLPFVAMIRGWGGLEECVRADPPTSVQRTDDGENARTREPPPFDSTSHCVMRGPASTSTTRRSTPSDRPG